MKRHVEIIRLLLEKGADAEASDKSGRTPIYYAFQSCNLDVIDAFKTTPAFHLNPQVTKYLTLLAAKIDKQEMSFETIPDDPLPCGFSLLHMAALFGHFDSAKMLLDNGCQVDAIDDSGSTPLLLACHNGYLKVAKLLLDRSANVHARNQHNSSAILLAAEYGHIDIVHLIISHGGDIESADNYLCRPLHVAAMFGHLDIVQVLLDNGSDF